MSNLIKKVHIIGIGGCASSAIAEFLLKQDVLVSGSELKQIEQLSNLTQLGAKITRHHKSNNLYLNGQPDLVLYSPAVSTLDPGNPELVEAKKKKIALKTWQEFIGHYLNQQGKTGITVSGSEGKGTTAGILTSLLKGTVFDPLSILGAQIRRINAGQDSNIYVGKGSCYLLEADEFNRNFFHYQPGINLMINFQYEHPETYPDFDQYQAAFYHFFNQMSQPRKLILNVSHSIIAFVKKYQLDKSHQIVWFGSEQNTDQLEPGSQFYTLKNHHLSAEGNQFELSKNGNIDLYHIKALPGYIINNAAGAIIAALELGLDRQLIKKHLLDFKGMVRRFDVYQTKKNGIIITDYGHSPQAVTKIIQEIRAIYRDKKIHIIFQPHLFSRTYNFFASFITSLKEADKVSLVDIYPAREKKELWQDKISSQMLSEKLKKEIKNVFFLGPSHEIDVQLKDHIDQREITCFLGAGDMDLYYPRILDQLEAKNYF